MPKRPLTGAALRSHQLKTCAAPPAPLGNTRAAKHGAQAEPLVAPRREAHLRVLREDYPHLDHRRLTLLADRLARIDLATAWLDKQKSLARNASGEPYSIAVLVEKWSAAAEKVLKECEAERAKPKRIDLAMAMSDLGEAEDGPLDSTFDG